ncbi:hypothetical protein PIB30_083296 [Stylosanthes scabra]|uniref:Uncharacterized protein n=1 Tax=Stylosanthes scabra TaxID=79078 RepID=A0ABU6UU00_9FABA|nr:hypothetical protein [Stylosanthes scabra]
MKRSPFVVADSVASPSQLRRTLCIGSIYEKHRKSSRQGGSSGESCVLCGGVMGKYSNVVKELRELCSMWRPTLEGEIVVVQV